MKIRDEKIISETIQALANKSRKLLKNSDVRDSRVAEILFSIIGLRSYLLQIERRDS